MKRLIASFYFLGLILLTGTAGALSEKMLQGDFAETIDQYFATSGKPGILKTDDHINISYTRFDEQCGDTALVIVPGWSEPKEKYAELIYDLKDQDFCVYILDHRSQGSSSRLLDNSQITYVKSFHDYVTDLKKFDREIVRSRPHRNVFVLAHSMGGLIATSYVAESADDFSGLILSAPMFQPDTGFFPETVAYGISGLLIGLGQGKAFVPTHGEWKPKAFAENRQTQSWIRFARSEQLFIDNQSLIVSGVSNQWLKSAIETSRLTPQYKTAITAPVLLFQATDDSFVRPERQNAFCLDNPYCEKVVLKNARHEILMEIDPIRSKVLDYILKFIAKNSSKS